MDTTPATQIPQPPRFTNLNDCVSWAEANLVNAKLSVEASCIWYDRFRKPSQRSVKLLGVSPKAQKIVDTIAPGGEWILEITNKTNQMIQLTAWYTRFAPYAMAMCQSEDGFHCLGLDFESINCLY